MKYAIALLTLVAVSCTTTYNIENPILVVEANAEPAAQLIQVVQKYDSHAWHVAVQKVRNTYARIVHFPENRELAQFTSIFLKGLSVSEDLYEESLKLPVSNSVAMPNVNSLKFCYSLQRRFDRVISQLAPFTKSQDIHLSKAAEDATAYFAHQKALFASIAEVDYEKWNSLVVPAAVSWAKAHFLEQRDFVCKRMMQFYSKLAEMDWAVIGPIAVSFLFLGSWP